MATKAQTTAIRDALDAEVSTELDLLIALTPIQRRGLAGAEILIRIERFLRISNELSILISRMV